MSATFRGLARLYNRLMPIVSLEWRSTSGLAPRLRVAYSAARLLGTDIALASAHRLRRFAGQPVPVYLDDIVHYVDLYANEIVPLIEIYGGAMYNRVPGFAAGPGQVVVDIGANIGAFALWQAKRGATVYAYEPNPDSYMRLSRAVTHNRLKGQVFTFEQAVSNIEGRGSLVVPDQNSTAGSLQPDSEGSISVTTLPALIDRHALTHIDILKIDAEGSEAAILRAGRNALDRVRHLVLEYHSRELEEQCTNILTMQGFTILHRIVVDEESGGGVLYADYTSLSN